MHPSKPPFNDELSRLETFRNIYLSTEYGQIDCLGQIMGIGSFKETLENSTEIEIRGKKCRIITLDALIKSKESLGRQKDKEAVVILKALLEKTMDNH
jgi:predicted nucleotidyltransferase